MKVAARLYHTVRAWLTGCLPGALHDDRFQLLTRRLTIAADGRRERTTRQPQNVGLIVGRFDEQRREPLRSCKGVARGLRPSGVKERVALGTGSASLPQGTDQAGLDSREVGERLQTRAE